MSGRPSAASRAGGAAEEAAVRAVGEEHVDGTAVLHHVDAQHLGGVAAEAPDRSRTAVVAGDGIGASLLDLAARHRGRPGPVLEDRQETERRNVDAAARRRGKINRHQPAVRADDLDRERLDLRRANGVIQNVAQLDVVLSGVDRVDDVAVLGDRGTYTQADLVDADSPGEKDLDPHVEGEGLDDRVVAVFGFDAGGAVAAVARRRTGHARRLLRGHGDVHRDGAGIAVGGIELQRGDQRLEFRLGSGEGPGQASVDMRHITAEAGVIDELGIGIAGDRRAAAQRHLDGRHRLRAVVVEATGIEEVAAGIVGIAASQPQQQSKVDQGTVGGNAVAAVLISAPPSATASTGTTKSLSPTALSDPSTAVASMLKLPSMSLSWGGVAWISPEKLVTLPTRVSVSVVVPSPSTEAI